MTVVAEVQHRFDNAELTADRAALEELIAEDFLSIGPKGFVLDKRQWIDRHDEFTYQALEVSELDVREYGGAAVVRTVQRNKATYAGPSRSPRACARSGSNRVTGGGW